MKIILSRKGFDSSNGGQPSPILPDGTLLSLPIMSDDIQNQFSTLFWNNLSYKEIIESLRHNSTKNNNDNCHLDPDLRANLRDRLPNWRPAFGQMESALSALRNNGVSEGDLFLFFGWFRQSEFDENGKLRYRANAPDLHIIYGYLQIGKIITQKSNVPEWLKDHPHVDYDEAWNKNRNAIFVASDHLSALQSDLAGANILDYRKNRVLTKEGYSRRFWDLPEFFKETKISYHPNPWKNNYFESAGRGQEFVMDATPEIINWAKNIII